jgi:hypothetical protein
MLTFQRAADALAFAGRPMLVYPSFTHPGAEP